MFAHAGLFRKLVNDHGGCVGQLVAGQAEQFFAHGLGCQKLFTAVGQLIRCVPPGLLGQELLANIEHAGDVFGVFGRNRNEFCEGMALLHLLQPGREVRAALYLIKLVGHQQGGHLFTEQGQHFGIGLVEHTGFDHEQNQVHITDRTNDGFVQRPVERIVVAGLKTRCIDKHKLRRAARMHAGDAVAGGLRLAGCDADFLPDQRVHQRGFAHIGFAHNSDQPAALTGLCGGRVRRFHAGFQQALQHGIQRFCILRRLGGLRCGFG